MKTVFALLFFISTMGLFSQPVDYYFDREVDEFPYEQMVQEYQKTVSPESRSANSRGFDAYDAGKLTEAERLWTEAVRLDDNNHFAHFNLACVKSLLMDRDGRDRTNDILLHLKKAWAGSIYWRYKTFVDPDLEPVKKDCFKLGIVYPSSGDMGLDSYYYFFPNGTMAAGYDYTALIGGTYPGPANLQHGYYTMIGNIAFIFMPYGDGIEQFRDHLIQWAGEEPEPVYWMIKPLIQEQYIELDSDFSAGNG